MPAGSKPWGALPKDTPPEDVLAHYGINPYTKLDLKSFDKQTQRAIRDMRFKRVHEWYIRPKQLRWIYETGAREWGLSQRTMRTLLAEVRDYLTQLAADMQAAPHAALAVSDELLRRAAEIADSQEDAKTLERVAKTYAEIFGGHRSKIDFQGQLHHTLAGLVQAAEQPPALPAAAVKNLPAANISLGDFHGPVSELVDATVEDHESDGDE